MECNEWITCVQTMEICACFSHWNLSISLCILRNSSGFNCTIGPDNSSVLLECVQQQSGVVRFLLEPFTPGQQHELPPGTDHFKGQLLEGVLLLDLTWKKTAALLCCFDNLKWGDWNFMFNDFYYHFIGHSTVGWGRQIIQFEVLHWFIRFCRRWAVKSAHCHFWIVGCLNEG